MTTPIESIDHLPSQILFALARNPSASPAYRKAAVALMIDRKCPLEQLLDSDVFSVYNSILEERAALHEVESIVESAIEAPLAPAQPEKPTEQPSGALRASVTTASL